MQDKLRRRLDFRRSSADSNAIATKPSDLTRLVRASRTERSSSTIAMTTVLGNFGS
jgi:hypothetical protein